MAESREADATRDRAFADALRSLNERLAAVKDGANGADGLPGRDGIDGRDGAEGPVGPAGADGRDGADGKDGVDGAPGERGEAGPAGETGPAGVAGLQGEPGVQGEPGSAGADGINGAPGEAGQPGKDGADAYHGEARGLFNATATYRALDVVSFNGCEWRAKRDDPGDIPGDGWMLSASKGKRGDRGEKGAAGANLIAAYVDRDSLELVLTREDGAEIKADLVGLTQVIREGHA